MICRAALGEELVARVGWVGHEGIKASVVVIGTVNTIIIIKVIVAVVEIIIIVIVEVIVIIIVWLKRCWLHGGEKTFLWARGVRMGLCGAGVELGVVDIVDGDV